MLQDLISLEQREKNRYQAMIHGMEVEGDGIMNADDPTQGAGTSAWQEAQRRALEVNANRRRN